MWKGYREAQCAFTEISERNRKDNPSESRRSGLFLVIYAPRKAIIEIWCLQKGPKVATFQASKHGFLIQNTNESSSTQHRSSRSSKASCLFFDADDSSLKNFSIPFHCILSETNSQSAEDFHYLKRLKMTLKNVDMKEPDGVSSVLELCEKFQTPEIKVKSLELLTSYRKTEPEVIQEVIKIFMKSPESASDETVEAEEDEIQDAIYREQLHASCVNLQSLIDCYLLATTHEEEFENPMKNDSIELLDNEFLTVQRIVELMSFTKAKPSSPAAKNVSFKENDESIVSFLTSFVVNTEKVRINPKQSKSAFDQIGSILFSAVWNEKISVTRLAVIFEASKIDSEAIMSCFLHFWLQQEVDFTDEETVLCEMTKFKHVLDQVCLFAAEKVTYAYNSICLFWQDVREYLLESNNPINSLLAAIICKNYALKKQDDSQEFGFEEVTQEECQWTLLNEKLNDVAVLSIFVSQFSQFGGRGSSSKEKYEAPNISLKKILNEGKGIISELVASWLIGVNLPINLIFNTSPEEGLELEEKNVIKKLEILRQHFPYSMNAAVILSYVIWELLSGRWSKNLSEMQHLRRGIEYLELFEEKDFHLKQGLCVLLWNGIFKIPLKATQKLINKTGRLPKEKLCLQNTLIPDFLMPQFLELTIRFLDHFRTSINYTKLEFKCEEILSQGLSASSLCEMIMQQSRGNLPLLNLHYEMVMVLELIAFLNIKHTKPMAVLFDDVCNEAFFMDINKDPPYTIQKPDEIRNSTRVFFLKKAITTTIDLIIECQQSTYFDDHLKWVEKIKKTGEIWNLDISILERHHVSSIVWS